jgi:uncharacterized membrane protein
MDVKHEIEKCTWQQRFGGAPNKISAAAASARRQAFLGGGGGGGGGATGLDL